ncbi:MAG: hypothetical protein H0T79_23085 [Deltaproteobacteria bacterium]|nr:hypothetical protein [Deltaproteobacteria bacterium]
MPFAWVLGVGLVLAIIAGARVTRPGDATPVSTRMLGRVALIMGLAIATVIAIDRALN